MFAIPHYPIPAALEVPLRSVCLRVKRKKNKKNSKIYLRRARDRWGTAE
jgi:hypothetical protein